MAHKISDERLNLHLRTEKAVKEWIEKVLSIRLDDNLQKALSTGVVLCYLMTEIEERSIPRIQENTNQPWRLKENIHFFLLALQDYGIGRHRIFLLSDLYEGKNMVMVVESLAELARVASSRGFQIAMKNPEQDTSPVPNLPADVKKMKKDQISRLKDKANEKTRVKVSAEIVRRKLQVLAGQGIDWAKFERNLAKFQALVRGHNARKRYRSIVRDVAYRANVAKEILETEKSYVSSLTTCIKVFMTPLEEMVNKNPKTALASNDDIRVIFCNIVPILNFHVTLLSMMEPRVKDWTPRQCLGDIFLQLVAFLKVYTIYLQNFNDSNTRLHSLMKNEKFAKFLEEGQKQSSSRLDLPSFLIMPVQRVPRYNLLLKDLAKHTWPEHPDYEAMNNLVTQIATLGAFLNTKNKEAENMKSLIELTNNIAKLPSTLLIVEPHRRLVQEYAMPEQKMMVYFFNDMILIGKTGGFMKDIKYKDHFFLLSVILKDVPDDKQHKNAIVIERDGHHKPFKLSLPTPAAKSEILKHHSEQRNAVEAMALEKKKELQHQSQLSSGQTNEEILANRKKKARGSAMMTTSARVRGITDVNLLIREKEGLEVKLMELTSNEKKKKKSKKELEQEEEQKHILEKDLADIRLRIEELQQPSDDPSKRKSSLLGPNKSADSIPHKKGATSLSPVGTPTSSPAVTPKNDNSSSGSNSASASPQTGQKEEKKKKKKGLMAGLVAAVTGSSSEGKVDSKALSSADLTGSNSPNTSLVITDSSTQAVSLSVPTVSSASRLNSPARKSVDGAPSPVPEKRTLNTSKPDLTFKSPATPNTTPPSSPHPPSLNSSGEADAIPGKPESGYLGYEQIKQTRTQLDQTKLESYLNDVEFVEVFKMSKDEFYKLPQWKRNQQKRAVSLL